MEVTEELVAAASKGKRDAVVELLAMHYAMVWRMANALTGRADVGRGVVKYVMQRSLRALPHWKNEADPTRWFCHHTILTTRRTKKHSPDLKNDTLLDKSPDAGYLAFIRALRGLPMQQREAFILTHGEKLDLRATATTMDCSTTAAANHLREAADQLRLLAPQEYDRHQQRMANAYKTLSPDEELGLHAVRGRVMRFVRPWLIKKTLRLIFTLILIGIAAWGGWWAWQIVQHSL